MDTTALDMFLRSAMAQNQPAQQAPTPAVGPQMPVPPMPGQLPDNSTSTPQGQVGQTPVQSNEDIAFQNLLQSIKDASSVQPAAVPPAPKLNDTELGVGAIGSFLQSLGRPNFDQNAAFDRFTGQRMGIKQNAWQVQAQNAQNQNTAAQKKADAKVAVAQSIYKKESDAATARAKSEADIFKATEATKRAEIRAGATKYAADRGYAKAVATSDTFQIGKILEDYANGALTTEQRDQAIGAIHGGDPYKAQQTQAEISKTLTEVDWIPYDKAIDAQKVQGTLLMLNAHLQQMSNQQWQAGNNAMHMSYEEQLSAANLAEGAAKAAEGVASQMEGPLSTMKSDLSRLTSKMNEINGKLQAANEQAKSSDEDTANQGKAAAARYLSELQGVSGQVLDKQKQVDKGTATIAKYRQEAADIRARAVVPVAPTYSQPPIGQKAPDFVAPETPAPRVSSGGATGNVDSKGSGVKTNNPPPTAKIGITLPPGDGGPSEPFITPGRPLVLPKQKVKTTKPKDKSKAPNSGKGLKNVRSAADVFGAMGL